LACDYAFQERPHIFESGATILRRLTSHKCKEVIVIAVVVLTTAGSEEEAAKIAQALVERRLAACVNVIPGVRSTYRWQGAVQTDTEWLLVVKTDRDRFPEVRSTIKELHSYEVPEAVMLEIDDGDPGYLAWLADNVRRGD
jgi:periplasmic divalent cation tolerance protein